MNRKLNRKLKICLFALAALSTIVHAENFKVKLDFTNVPVEALSKVGKIYILAWDKKNFLDDELLIKEGKVVSSLEPSTVINTTISISAEELNFEQDLAFTVFVDNNGNTDFDRKQEIFGCTTTNKNLRNQVNFWNYMFKRDKIFNSCRIKLKDLQASNQPLSFLLTTL